MCEKKKGTHFLCRGDGITLPQAVFPTAAKGFPKLPEKLAHQHLPETSVDTAALKSLFLHRKLL
jgi:hypothetical protein